MTKTAAQAIDAELATIGAILVEPALAPKARLYLEAGDFFSEKNRYTYAAICELLERDGPGAVDIVLVAQHLRTRGELESAGGTAHLAACQEVAVTAENVELYAKLVREASLDRMVTGQLRKTYEDKTPENVTDLGDLILSLNGLHGRPIFDCRVGLLDKIEKLMERQSSSVKTGFDTLDAVLGGIALGDLCVVGARPGVGKTAFLTRAACNMAMAGHEVLYLTTEMSEEQMLARILPMATKIPAYKFRTRDENGDLSLSENDKRTIIDKVAAGLNQLPLKILGKSMFSLDEIRSAGIRAKADVIVVDLLQRCKLGSKHESVAYAIEEFLVGLKSFALDTGIRVFLAAQLDRESDRNPGKPPVLADLRGSAGIEHQANQALLMWKPPRPKNPPENYIPPSPGCTAVEVIVKKARDGPADIAVDLELNGEFVQMQERSSAYLND